MPARVPWSVVHKRATLHGTALVLVSTAIYGTTPALVSMAQQSVGLIDLIIGRSFVAGSLLLIVWWSMRRTRKLRPPEPIGFRGVAVGGLLFAPQSVLFLGSLQRLDSSLAVALGYVYPSFVVLWMAARARRTPRRVELTALILALAGVFAVAARTGGSSIDPLGCLMVVASAVFFAAYAILTADLAVTVDPMQLGAHSLLGVVLALGGIELASGRLDLDLDGGGWMLIVIHGALLTGAVAAYTLGIAQTGAARASLLDTLQPVVALIVGTLLLAERPRPVQYAGILLILGSIVLSSIRARPPRPPAGDTI